GDLQERGAWLMSSKGDSQGQAATTPSLEALITAVKRAEYRTNRRNVVVISGVALIAIVTMLFWLSALHYQLKSAERNFQLAVGSIVNQTNQLAASLEYGGISANTTRTMLRSAEGTLHDLETIQPIPEIAR